MLMTRLKKTPIVPSLRFRVAILRRENMMSGSVLAGAPRACSTLGFAFADAAGVSIRGFALRAEAGAGTDLPGP